MTTPVVSIITTVHELEPYVDRCIQSVLDQTFQSWEQIIVDDGSIDGTESRIRRFEDPRIRYIRLPKRGIPGLAEGYNTALEAAGGELIAVLEGDDFWPPDKLAKQVPAFAAPDIQLTWGRAEVVNETGRPVRRWPSPAMRGDTLSLADLFRRLTCANILTPTVTVMARRTALEKIGGFHQPDGVLFVDLPTWLMLSAHLEGKARRLPETLGYYRAHSAQISTQNYYSYQTSQETVVDYTIARSDAAALRRVGWDDSQRRLSRASGTLSSALALLRSGKHREARTMLLSVVGNAPSLRAKVRTLLGLASTYLRVDLVTLAERARARLPG